jgi:hypothetical protein
MGTLPVTKQRCSENKIASVHRSTSQDMQFTFKVTQTLLSSGCDGVQDGAGTRSHPILGLPHDGMGTWTHQGGKKGVGRYANNWLVEGDIRGAKDASQDLPAHRIRFDRRGLEQLNQSIPDGDLVLAMCPYCAAGHGSVHSIC